MPQDETHVSQKVKKGSMKNTVSRRRLLKLGSTGTLAGVTGLGSLPFPTETVRAEVSEKVGTTGDTVYQNPVSTPAVENFGSPTVIRGRDGYWYAFGPGNPLNPGEDRLPKIPILRSPDLVSWEYVEDVFTGESEPEWVGERGRYWAPSVEFFNGTYYVYYTRTNIPEFPTPNRTIGVATSPTPTGPWTDLGGPLIGPKYWHPWPRATRHRSIIDPDVFTAVDGTRYLYYGGFNGGIYGIELTHDGLSTVGEPVKLTSAYAFEGPYVVHHEGYYYMFASSVPGGCCRGPASGYIVFAARSQSPLGPFVDRYGDSMLESGGTPVLAPNGNTWVGTGHNAMVTDLAGQDWLTFNGVNRDNPYLNEPLRGMRRPLLIDRLDWINGWPIVREGRWASDEPVPKPVTNGLIEDAFEDGDTLGSAWQPSAHWQVRHEPAGGFAHTGDHDGDRTLLADRGLPTDVRLRGTFRLPGDEETGATGFVLAGHEHGGGVQVLIDRTLQALVVTFRRGDGDWQSVSESLPASFDYQHWHELDVKIRGRELSAQVSSAGLYDPVAGVEVRLLEGLVAGRFGVVARDAAADIDDITATPLFEPHTDRVPDPKIGALDPAYSDDFDGGLDSAWSWVREPAATVRDGVLEFPIQDSDLSGPEDNNVSVLVRDVPAGTWTAETKLTLPFEDARPARWPQAGLVAYANDDQYLRLTSRAHGSSRVVSYQKEMPFAGGLVRGAGNGGAPGDTTWLRLHHRTDPENDEHEIRAASSRDGEHWTWAGVYTLPADAEVRIGLVSHSGAEPRVARFEYLHLFRP